MKSNSLAERYRKWKVKYETLSPKTVGMISFIRFVYEFGILTNIMFLGLFGWSITLERVLAFGIAWYFIKHQVRKTYEIWKGISE